MLVCGREQKEETQCDEEQRGRKEALKMMQKGKKRTEAEGIIDTEGRTPGDDCKK